MMRTVLGVVGGMLVLPVAAQAQEAGSFAVVRGQDTVAMETFTRQDVEIRGSLLRATGATSRERVRYHAVLVEDESTPLIDISAWRADDPEGAPARQSARVIFRDDSVAIDDAGQQGMMLTRIFPTVPSAVAYLNLSTVFLEQATRRAAHARRDSLAVPFFNLGGGQTVTGTVRRLAADSAAVRIGTVEYRVQVDGEGRILGGTVPSQGLVITRAQGR